MAGFRSALAHALRLVTLLTVPAAIGLIMLAEPIIALLYQHGRFTFDATRQTAAALQFYAIGLAAYSAIKVLAPAFYAIDRRYLPMMVSVFSIGLNFVLNWFFMFKVHLGHRGLALSTSLVALTNFVLLYVLMRRHSGRLETGQLLRTLLKVFAAGAVLALICWLAAQFFFARMPLSLWEEALELLMTIALGAIAFFAVAYFLGVNEVRDVVDLVKRRFGRRD
jgi:putative peptidoglycan lipid II flippase